MEESKGKTEDCNTGLDETEGKCEIWERTWKMSSEQRYDRGQNIMKHQRKVIKMGLTTPFPQIMLQDLDSNLRVIHHSHTKYYFGGDGVSKEIFETFSGCSMNFSTIVDGGTFIMICQR